MSRWAGSSGDGGAKSPAKAHKAAGHGWARLETVERGGWAKYEPLRAFGLVQRYMEKGQPDEKGKKQSHWFDMQEGFALDCLVLGEGDQRRVYVVTSTPPEEYSWIHDRWPMIRTLIPS